MSALGAIGSAASAWRDAWRDRRDNPLSAWAVNERRRLAAQPWLRRSPGLTLLAMTLALAVTAVNLWLLYDLLHLPEVTPRHAFAYTAGAGMQLLRAALIFVVFWYLPCFYAVMQFAFSFLSTASRRKVELAVDDSLAVTTVSDAELLFGALRHGLARLMPPMAVLALAASLYAVREQWVSMLGAQGERESALTSLEAWSLAAQGELMLVMLLSCGVVTTAALLLLAVALSRGRFPILLATIGAVVMTLAQPVAWGMHGTYTSMLLTEWLDEWPTALRVIADYSWTALLVLAALAWAAERRAWLRVGLLVTLPISWFLLHRVVGAAVSELCGGPGFGTSYVLLAAGIVSPLSGGLMFTYESWLGEGTAPVWFEVPLWLLTLGYQCLFLVIATYFAMRSIRLRRRGVE